MERTVLPGDLVKFDFWSSYLAPVAIPDAYGKVDWFELFPGDRGIVVAADEDNEDDNTVIVMFSRINRLLRVHVTQLTRADELKE